MRTTRLLFRIWTVSALSLTSGCGGSAHLTVDDGMGTGFIPRRCIFFQNFSTSR